MRIDGAYTYMTCTQFHTFFSLNNIIPWITITFVPTCNTIMHNVDYQFLKATTTQITLVS